MNDGEIESKNSDIEEYPGLTSADVTRLTKEGKTNKLPNQSSKSVAAIFVENILTYFNAIFFALAFLIIMVGAYRNLTFLPVVIANIVIGIVQQLRAKKVLDELSLLDITEYTAIRDGVEVQVDVERLVLGDVIRLSSGQQIPADAEVISGKISVNEALLTGEADEIEKEEGGALMSGSFVVSGDCTAVLTHVGADSYAAKLTSKAKEVKNKKSEMIKDIETIIKVAGIIIIPVGILMVVNSVIINGRSLQDGIVAMVGAIVGMIPEGLYLLLTVALTMSAARLARKKVLLHDMKSIETLARVDVLCVDKTGTITNEVMSVTDIFLPANAEKTAQPVYQSPAEAGRGTLVQSDQHRASGTMENRATGILENRASGTTEDRASGTTEHGVPGDIVAARELLSRYIHTVPDSNITMLALRDYFSDPSQLEDTVSVTPFSSALKYSEISTSEAVYRFGAPEFLLSDELLAGNKDIIESHTGRGERVLVFVRSDAGVRSEADGQGCKADNAPLIFVSLANEIRSTAPATFSYFAEQGVTVKVISGDNPLTVSRVALAAKIEGAENYIDASTLITDEDYSTAVEKYTVFGRVKPEQKKSLIEAIKKNGKSVAMTGDGVNDILAMKEADCSIAMGGGSDAARQAAQVVLLDSDFSHMEQIVSEGRRIINNMTRSGILFLYKNIFSLLLALFTIILTIHYPLKPTQISLISMFNIGLPGFLLAMENNTKRQRGRLLTNTLIGALPASLLSFVMIAVITASGPLIGMTEDEVGVAGTFLLSAVGFVLLWRCIRPLNRYRTIVYTICVVGMIISIIGLWNIFILAEVTLSGLLIAVGYALAGAGLMWAMANFILKKLG